ncbi:NHL repeat protein [Planctomycetes bacterium CA13]|uniref:NHL repeat protein n=1 Tax=Novipirellula herctigrandis TaxID=2527986 RepID=A0A5C5YVG2_9BACT|nr:NHL repeat protein [Planctomycetes bacterium CA13]
MNRIIPIATTTLLTLIFFPDACRGVEPPRLLDDNWQIELVASEPDLVTPVGCCFDSQGRLLVVESHTHFPPDDYDGPKSDQIFIFDDTNDDGKVDRQRLYYEGGTATMSIRSLPDGWIAVSTRSEVYRIRDTNDDDVADEREVLLTLQTESTYPHNGLTGLAVGPDGRLYVGQGENLGEPYTLVARDGTKQIGGGEGGNVFSIAPDGRGLRRHATGFWNPFGLWFDHAGRLWAVGNDPDAMPPCRLLEVIPYADYGFQFRFGRAGTHPLQAWNGELPGTLPMVAAVGEAPCAVLGHGEHLWVTSWGDNRMERYKIRPRGASWQSEAEVIVQGNANFRPVDMAVDADGAIYVTDWVDRSYPVHGKGRLWRLSRQTHTDEFNKKLPEPNNIESTFAKLLRSPDLSAQERLAAFDLDDPFLRQATLAGLINTGQIASCEKTQLDTAAQRVGVLTAWRWISVTQPEKLSKDDRRHWIEWGLADSSSTVVLTAVRWATETSDKTFLPVTRSLLTRQNLTPELFAATVSAVAYLENGTTVQRGSDPAIDALLLAVASDPKRSSKLRSMAVRMLPSESRVPTDERLRGWITQNTERALAIDVIRLLSARATSASLDQLAIIAADTSIDDQTRADAIAGLSRNAGTYAKVLNPLAIPKQTDVIRTEAGRVLKRDWQYHASERPPGKDAEAWNTFVGRGGDVDAGRRVFFRSTCVNCHAHGGRGATTGPDLTSLAGRMTSTRVLESILEPSREVGPMYVPWRVLTVDGHVLTGLKLGNSGIGESLRFQGADGLVFDVLLEDIERQDPVSQSIMPAGLEETMTIAELRDLIAFLTSDA